MSRQACRITRHPQRASRDGGHSGKEGDTVLVLMRGFGPHLSHSTLVFPQPAGRAIGGSRHGKSRWGKVICSKED